MKRKIVLLTYSLDAGGAERVVSILANKLQEHYDITLVLMNKTHYYVLPKSIKIIYLEDSDPEESGWKKLAKLPLLGYRLKVLCAAEGIDTVISFMNRPNYIAAFSKLFGSTAKILISERSQPSIQHRGGMQGWINRSLIRLLYPYADAVIANSYGNRADLQKFFGISKVITINNPVDLDMINISLLEKVNLPSKNRFVFVTVGRLDKGKNHHLIIEAIKGMDADLWIIGDGPLKETLQAQIEKEKLEEKIILLGRQQNPFGFLAYADCFVFASNHEGFPNVLVEALACGLPVISTDCPSGPREILAPTLNQEQTQNSLEIEITEFGILTPVGDSFAMASAMRYMMKDITLRERYRQRAKNRAKAFDQSLIVNHFESLIEQIGE